MNHDKLVNNRIAFILLGLAWLIVVLVGVTQPVIGDASLYASISKRMAQSNEYMNLFLLGEPYIQKPHLLFWLSALSMKLLGFSTFSFKLPSLLIALLGVWGLYKTGVLLHSKQIGIYSSVLWLFSLAFLLHLNDIHMDTMMSGFIIWTAFFWLKYLKEHGYKWLFIGAIPLSLAMMTKGPLGAFVPVTGLIIAVIYNWGFLSLFRWQNFAAAAFSLVLLSPVLYSIYNQHGIDGLAFYFWENNAGRVDNGSESSKDYFFYVHTLAWFFIPWALLTFYSFGRLINGFIKKETSVGLVFFFSSFFVFFCVASMADGHAPHYIFTLLPFAALITAYFTLDHKHTKAKRIMLWIPLSLSIILMIGGLYLFPPKRALLILCLLSCIGSVILFYKKNEGVKQLVLVNASLVTMLFAILNIQVFRDYLMPYDAISNAAEYINEHAKTDEKFYVVDHNKHHPARADFYSNKEVLRKRDPQDIPLDENIWVLTPTDYKDELIALQQPNEVKELDYLLLTRPFLSIIAKLKNDDSRFKKMYLLDYTKDETTEN